MYHKGRLIEGYDIHFTQVINGDLDVSTTEVGKRVQWYSFQTRKKKQKTCVVVTIMIVFQKLEQKILEINSKEYMTKIYTWIIVCVCF